MNSSLYSIIFNKKGTSILGIAAGIHKRFIDAIIGKTGRLISGLIVCFW